MERKREAAAAAAPADEVKQNSPLTPEEFQFFITSYYYSIYPVELVFSAACRIF